MKRDEVHIIGAGGHTRSLVALLLDQQYQVSGFYDEHIHQGEEIVGVTGKTIDKLPLEGKVILSVGDNERRKVLFQQYRERLLCDPIVHSTAFVHDHVEFGKGVTVFGKAYINIAAFIGDNTIINTGALVEHEVKIGSHSHIAVNATLCGRVVIEDNVTIGAGALIKDGVRIASNTIIGAGAVVIKDIDEPGTFIGVPAKRIK